jgi:hypothetical protein
MIILTHLVPGVFPNIRRQLSYQLRLPGGARGIHPQLALRFIHQKHIVKLLQKNVVRLNFGR